MPKVSGSNLLNSMNLYVPPVSKSLVCVVRSSAELYVQYCTNRMNEGAQETLQKVYSKLNAHSNVILAATYSRERNGHLEKDLLFRALREVIEKHPALSLVMHDEPSKVKQGDHRSWEARLKTINLSECVSFLEGFDTSCNGLQKLLEQSHNEWFDVQDKTKPLWKLVVVNKSHVVFVFHHFIADGSSGVNFHHGLLSALNHELEDNKGSSIVPATSTSPVIPISSAHLPPRGLDLLTEQFSYYMILHSLLNMIHMFLLRFIIPRKYWLFPEVDFDRSLPSARQPSSKTQYPVTKVQRLYLNPTTLVSCLQLCRDNSVSFTALLYTLISITLAVDIYPEAKISNSNTQISLRRFVQGKKKDFADECMTNITSGFFYRPWLAAYRAAEVTAEESSTSPNDSLRIRQARTISPSVFWDLARKYKNDLDTRLVMPRSRTSPVVQDVLSLSRLMPADEEPFADAIFSTMRTVLPNCFSLSNLGAVTPNRTIGSWTISGMEFSVAAYGTGVGPVLYFAVISVKGGACVVNVDYQEGIIEDEVVNRVISGVEKRLLSMLN